MWERQNFCLLNFPNLENHLYVDLERHIRSECENLHFREKNAPVLCICVSSVFSETERAVLQDALEPVRTGTNKHRLGLLIVELFLEWKEGQL